MIYVRYCKLRTSDPDPLKRLHNINTVEIRRFMHWYLDHHNVERLNSFYVRMRFWRMMYEGKTHKKLDPILASDMMVVSWIHPMVHLPRTQADYYVVYRFSPQGWLWLKHPFEGQACYECRWLSSAPTPSLGPVYRLLYYRVGTSAAYSNHPFHSMYNRASINSCWRRWLLWHKRLPQI